MAPKKIRCSAKECREAAQRIVGDCGFCNGHFCGKHRLLEDHKCSGLEDVSDTPLHDASSHLGPAIPGRLGPRETRLQVRCFASSKPQPLAALADPLRPLGLPRRRRN